jgi:hypothetical protein
MLATVAGNPGVLLISVAVLAFGIYTAIDASRYPAWAFSQTGSPKWLFQVVAPIFGLLCGIVAIILGIMWFASKKAQVVRAVAGGQGVQPGMYGTSGPPPAPWGSPPAPGSWTPPVPPPVGPSSPPRGPYMPPPPPADDAPQS